MASGKLLGGLFGGPTGFLVGAAADRSNYDIGAAPQAPALDSRLADLRSKQLAQAQEFRSNLPETAARQQRQSSSDMRSALTARQRDITKESSQRGTLYSGLRAASEQRAAQQAAQGLAAQNQQVNQMLENQAQGLEGNAVSNAFGAANQQGQMQNADLQRAIQSRAGKLNERGQIVGGIAKIGGTIAGMA